MKSEGDVVRGVSRVKLRFKNLSEPGEVIKLQSSKEFSSKKEAEKLALKLLEICVPIKDAKQYEVEAFYD